VRRVVQHTAYAYAYQLMVVKDSYVHNLITFNL